MIIAKKSHYFSQLAGGLLIKNTHSCMIKKKWHDFNVQRHQMHLILNPTRGYVNITFFFISFGCKGNSLFFSCSILYALIWAGFTELISHWRQYLLCLYAFKIVFVV